MRAFAEALIAHDARKYKARKPAPAFPVCDKLRPQLSTLVGNTGYHALISRALVLAAAQAPGLRQVKVNGDGTLEGVEALHAKLKPNDFLESHGALLTQLLGLLVAFIGENLTLRLVGEIWPGLPMDNFNFGRGGKK